MTSIIDAPTALALLEAAVELAGPDHVYEVQPDAISCRYVHGDQPGCIIAVALSIHGVPLGVLQRWDDANERGTGITTVYHMLDAARLMTDDAVQVFAAAQRLQDEALWPVMSRPHGTDITWGAALEAAREHVADSAL